MITLPGFYGHNIEAAFEDTRLAVSPNSDVAMCDQYAIDLSPESLQQDIDNLKDSDDIDWIWNNHQDITVLDDVNDTSLDINNGWKYTY